MDHLVSEYIQAIEYNGEDSNGLLLAQRLLCCHFAVFEFPFPLCLGEATIVVIPEWLKDIFVFDQQTNRAGKLGPDDLIQQVLVI
jgi:hypothetical protein